MAESLWQLELLGDLRAIATDAAQTEIDRFESRRTAALLAYLALSTRRRIPREELVDRIWPDADPESGRNRLKQALASLRRLFEAPVDGHGSVFIADRLSVGLNPGAIVTDVSAFERAVADGDHDRARRLYRGELLSGLYDDWVIDARHRLEAVRQSLGDPTPARDRTARRAPRRPPEPLTRIFGRDREVDAVQRALERARWVTLIGPGGIGKTRLALEVARCRDADEVWWAPLVDLADVSHLGDALRVAVGLGEDPHRDPLDQVMEDLAGRHGLLLLDNAEHLVESGVAAPLRALLEGAPGLRILTTSRRALGGTGETLLPVGPLPSTRDPRDDPAVNLFADRAGENGSPIELTEPVAHQIAEICRSLDRIPLALELVAAWTQAFDLSDILERVLAGDPIITTARRRDVPERHRSLQRAFEGSYRLLGAGARQLFSRLSVFAGGGAVRSVAAVCDDARAQERLLDLADASFVHMTRGRTGAARFTLLESLRQLAPVDDDAALRMRHAQHFLALARDASRIAPPLDQIQWCEAIDEDWANFVAAARSGDPDTALLVPALLAEYVGIRGRVRPAFGLLSDALSQGFGSPAARAIALAQRAAWISEVENLTSAQEPLLAAREAARGVDEAEALALYHLGRIAYQRRDFAAAWDWHAESWALRRQERGTARATSAYALAQIAYRWPAAPEPAPLLLDRAERLARESGGLAILAEILNERACIRIWEGDHDAARPLLSDSSALARQLGCERLEAKVANQWGEIQRLRGDVAEALPHYRNAARLLDRLQDRAAAHFPVWNLACAFHSLDDPLRALALSACAVRLWEAAGRTLLEDDRATVAAYRDAVVARWGEVQAERTWRDGYQMSVEEAAALSEADALYGGFTIER